MKMYEDCPHISNLKYLFNNIDRQQSLFRLSNALFEALIVWHTHVNLSCVVEKRFFESTLASLDLPGQESGRKNQIVDKEEDQNYLTFLDIIIA